MRPPDQRKVGCFNYDTYLRRRDFLRVGSLSLMGMGLSQYLQLKSVMAAAGVDVEKKAKAQSVILLFLEGGPSQVDTWDPKPNSSFRPISTNVPGIQISELLPLTAQRMDKLSIIRSIHHTDTNHDGGFHVALTGHDPTPAMRFPSLGSIITKELGPRNEVPPHILEPETIFDNFFNSGFLGTQYDPLILSDPSKEDFQVTDLSLPKSLSAKRIEDRRSFLTLVDRLYRQKEELAEYGDRDMFRDQALKMILAPEVKNAFDLSQESDKVKDAYGRYGFGQSVLLARRLAEAGCRFVTAAGYDGNDWDTHGLGSGGENDKDHRDRLCPTFDKTFTTLLDDLEQRGMLESTVVLAMGEFGRTPDINQIAGRDHWPWVYSVVLGGGGIRGGHVIGASDDKGAYPAERPMGMGDVFATIYKAFGIDWTKTYMTPVGRPVKIATTTDDKTGTPIPELI